MLIKAIYEDPYRDYPESLITEVEYKRELQSFFPRCDLWPYEKALAEFNRLYDVAEANGHLDMFNDYKDKYGEF